MVQKPYPEINTPKKQSMSTQTLSFKCSGPHFLEQTKDAHQLTEKEIQNCLKYYVSHFIKS